MRLAQGTDGKKTKDEMELLFDNFCDEVSAGKGSVEIKNHHENWREDRTLLQMLTKKNPKTLDVIRHVVTVYGLVKEVLKKDIGGERFSRSVRFASHRHGECNILETPESLLSVIDEIREQVFAFSSPEEFEEARNALEKACKGTELDLLRNKLPGDWFLSLYEMASREESGLDVSESYIVGPVDVHEHSKWKNLFRKDTLLWEESAKEYRIHGMAFKDDQYKGGYLKYVLNQRVDNTTRKVLFRQDIFSVVIPNEKGRDRVFSIKDPEALLEALEAQVREEVRGV